MSLTPVFGPCSLPTGCHCRQVISQQLPKSLPQSARPTGSSVPPAQTFKALYFASVWGFWVMPASPNVCSAPEVLLSSVPFQKTHPNQP